MTNRLSQDYVPIHYELYLHIKKDFPQCDASVTITFKKNNNSDSAYLNIGRNIQIKSIVQNNTPLNYIVEYPNLLIFCSEQSVDISSFPITIKYTVEPSTHEKAGFFYAYKCYFTDFEPNEAKKLLPCFDDPCIRSSFSVKLRIPSDLTGISNMPIQTLTNYGDESELIFMRSPPMCTYLLCICVGDFGSISGTTINNTQIDFYSKSGDEKYFNEYLNVAIFAIEWLENTFGVKYELPRLQLISHNGIICGMENYGLITLPDYSCSPNSKTYKLVVAHEVVHQWFGDLVSIKWWDSLWLNEGFAEFFQYFILYDLTHLDRIWEKLVDDESCDSLSYFKKGIISPPENQIDFENMFDSLIYAKGCMVVKMFYDIIGKCDFFRICSKWLDKYKNKSVDISDFISLVNSTLNKDFSGFFNNWLKCEGFPALAVHEIVDDNDKSKFIGINISQITSNDCYQFKVKIKYEINGEIKVIDTMIDKFVQKVDVEFDWILVNDNIQSLCFVIYSKPLYEKLKKANIEDKLNENDTYLIGKSIRKRAIPDMIDDDIVAISKHF